MLLADGIRNIPIGTPSSQDTAILSGAQLDLENYHGDKLADDSEQFAQDEQRYNPSGPDRYYLRQGADLGHHHPRERLPGFPQYGPAHPSPGMSQAPY